MTRKRNLSNANLAHVNLSGDHLAGFVQELQTLGAFASEITVGPSHRCPMVAVRDHKPMYRVTRQRPCQECLLAEHGLAAWRRIGTSRDGDQLANARTEGEPSWEPVGH